MNKNLILVIVSLCSALTAVHAIQCYTCFYDRDLPNLSDVLSNEECISDNFDGENVKNEEGFSKCYKALAYTEEGDIVAAHRGGGNAALTSFYELVSRDGDDFLIVYCHEDLCNGAPSTMTSLGLLSSAVIILFTRMFFQ